MCAPARGATPPSHGYLQDRHWLSSFPDTLPICLLLNSLFLDLGLGDDHGLKVLPLGDLSLELCDDGGDVKLVLWFRVLVSAVWYHFRVFSGAQGRGGVSSANGASGLRKVITYIFRLGPFLLGQKLVSKRALSRC